MARTFTSATGPLFAFPINGKGGKGQRAIPNRQTHPEPAVQILGIFRENLLLRARRDTGLFAQDIHDFGADVHGTEGFNNIFVSSSLPAPFLFGCLTFGSQHDNINAFEIRIVLD